MVELNKIWQMLFVFTKIEMRASKYAQNTLLRSANLFDYGEFHSANLPFFVIFSQIDPWPIWALAEAIPGVRAKQGPGWLEPKKWCHSRTEYEFPVEMWISRCFFEGELTVERYLQGSTTRRNRGTFQWRNTTPPGSHR